MPGRRHSQGYRGDFQMHSVWSDGAEPLDSIVEACLARGYSCAGITDHSYGLSIAGGMSMEAGGAATCRDRRAQPASTAAASACSRESRRTSAPTARWTWSRTSCDASSSSSPRRIRCCASRSTRPHGWSVPCRSRVSRYSGIRWGAMFNTAPGVRADWDQVFDDRRTAAGGDRDRRFVVDRQDVPYELAARALEHGLPLRARQRRACTPRARLRGDRHRARPARRAARGRASSTTGRTIRFWNGRAARGIADERGFALESTSISDPSSATGSVGRLAGREAGLGLAFALDAFWCSRCGTRG